MARLGLAAVGGLALGGVVIAAALWPSCERRPGHRGPPSADWAEVSSWAAPILPPGDPTLLAHALEQIAPEAKALDERVNELRRGEEGEPGRLDRADLPAAAVDAIDALVAWADESGGLPAADCWEAMSRSIDLFRLGKVALAAAQLDGAAPEAAAVLYLGRRLRSDGSSLLELAIGLSLAKRARDWAERAKLRPGPAFREHRPTRAELFRGLAAEVVCTDDRLRHIPDDAGPPGGIVDGPLLERYLAESRSWQVDLVRGARPLVDDEPALRAYFAAKRERVQSSDNPILKMIGLVPTQLERMLDDIDAYDRFLE